MNPWPLFFVIIGLTIGLAIMISLSDIEAVKGNWNEKRCNLNVMLTGFLYKPKDDTRNSVAFASDNFSFCVKKLARDAFLVGLTPLLAVLGKQLDVVGGVSRAVNTMRSLKAEMYHSFQRILDPFVRRFVQTGYQGSILFRRLYSAMERVSAVGLSTLFMGMGTYISISNTIEFVIMVCYIILGVLLALLFWMAWLLSPLLWLILGTLGAITAATAGANFCLDPETPIPLRNGRVCPLSSLRVGDILSDQSTVTGILEVDGQETPLFDLHGIRVSGTHLCWNEVKECWCPVMEHPHARPLSDRCPRLLCLRTSMRTLFAESPRTGRPVLFRDWEELPVHEEETADVLWEALLLGMLNSDTGGTGFPKAIPEEDPLLASDTRILNAEGKLQTIGSVRIGDRILQHPLDTKGTPVLGVYRGRAAFMTAGFTDGIWWKMPSGRWEHIFAPSNQNSPKPKEGFHLITKSGFFYVRTSNRVGIVRDFTEVGHDRIDETMPLVLDLLSKEKPPSREESCVRASLLPVS